MWWDAGAVGAGVKEDEGWVRTRMARLFTFSGALLMQVGPFKEGWVDLEKAVEQDAECVRARELKCVVGFKALKFDAVLQDVAWFKERAAAPTKYFVGAFLAASMACFMKARVVEGHEYAALAFETSSRFGDYPGPDPKMFVMAKETQVIFANKKGGL
ncbi:hypothetical protein BC830DRAFT_195007 [Chytriomyces sp. MP71]|nr:hypothetical protein BC830DRAFT_195007 [Chytriomyces sp. MP71]